MSKKKVAERLAKSGDLCAVRVLQARKRQLSLVKTFEWPGTKGRNKKHVILPGFIVSAESDRSWHFSRHTKVHTVVTEKKEGFCEAILFAGLVEKDGEYTHSFLKIPVAYRDIMLRTTPQDVQDAVNDFFVEAQDDLNKEVHQLNKALLAGALKSTGSQSKKEIDEVMSRFHFGSDRILIDVCPIRLAEILDVDLVSPVNVPKTIQWPTTD